MDTHTHNREPFAGLPEHILADLRALIGPVQAAGAYMEFDPLLPQTMGVALEGALFRIAVVSDKQGVPLRVEILGPPDLSVWDSATFLALLPDAAPAPAPPPPRQPLPERRDEREILEDVLLELKAIRKCLSQSAA